MPALSRRRRDLGDEVAHTARRPWRARIERDLVGVLEVAADRQAAGDPADDTDDGLEALGEVHRRGLAFQGRVRREDDLLERLAGPRCLVGAGEQLADAESLRPDPVDRRDRAVQDVIETLELGRPLQGQDVERLLHDAQPALVARRVAADGAQRPGR